MAKVEKDKVNLFEKYFEDWLLELEERGDVIMLEKHPQTFTLLSEVSLLYTQQLKTKVKDAYFNLFSSIVYTADFKFILHKDSPLCKFVTFIEPGSLGDPRNVFYCTSKTRTGNLIIYVDIKPPSRALKFSASLGSSREFPIKQRILYDTQNIYINKIVPYGQGKCLFSQTFTPKTFYYTESGKKVRSVGLNNKTKQQLYKPILLIELNKL